MIKLWIPPELSLTNGLNYNMPEITVFMAAYNAANFIEKSIESVLNQTFKDFELLIVNDGSTDNTVEIINHFQDERIRLISNENNRGLTYTRNVALKEAKGKYIAVLDSDDIALPNRLEKQYKILQENPDLGLCGSSAAVMDKRGNLTGELLTVSTGRENIKTTLLFKNTFVNSSVMFKANIFKEIGGYRDYAPAEDYDLFIRISYKCAVENLDEILVQYRIHDNNISKEKFETAKSQLKKIKENQLSKLQINASNNNLAETLFSILMLDFHSYRFKDYLTLFTQLVKANKKLRIYPEYNFQKMLFDQWYEIIHIKRARMNAMSLFFNRHIFRWPFVTVKQLRKVFKLSLKGIGIISR